MGKSKPKMDVTDYYMSLHFGVCAGPVDEFLTLWAGEKEAWKGSLSDTGTLNIDRADLFGGEKKEGGLRGLMTFLSGKSDQTLGEFLASKLGLTSETAPGYRGITSLFFTGGSGLAEPGETPSGIFDLISGVFSDALGLNSSSTTGGFMWGSNTPYLQSLWATVRRRPRGLSQGIAMIGDDANPIHVIYEVFIDTDWGLGAPASGLDNAAFEACAQTVYDEGMGISLLWSQPTSGENFISNVANHVSMMIFLHPRTGLMTPKLIRADYDADTLFEINPGNAKLSNWQRKLWGETVNEIVVSWTNPENEETETVSIQDLANISMQGGIVSDSRDFPGIRNADLAMKVAARELRIASAPLMACEAIVNREAWDVVPGDVVKVTWPKYGMNSVIMRVGPVDYGKIGDSTVRISLTEDIFSLATSHYTPPNGTQWRPVTVQPAPIQHSLAFTIPYMMLANGGLTISDEDYPSVVAGVIAAQPGVDTNEYIVVTEGTDPAGGTSDEGSEGKPMIPRAVTLDALPFEVTSTVEVGNPTRGLDVEVGFFALLGTTDEDMELCVVTGISGDDVTLLRGVLDTTPKEWPAGTPIWFLPPDVTYDDAVLRSGGEPVEYRLLSVTSQGTLPLTDADTVSATLTDRPWLPSRPANVMVDTHDNPFVAIIDLVSTTFEITWANRNRVVEDTVVLAWDAANVTPEAGQTTRIAVYSAEGDLLTEHASLSGTSFSLPVGSFAGRSYGLVKVTSERDDLESLQGVAYGITVNSGYGYAYGFNYGG